jgi:hypothetical protein
METLQLIVLWALRISCSFAAFIMVYTCLKARGVEGKWDAFFYSAMSAIVWFTI